MDVADTDRIVNAVPSGWRVLAVAVPTRALRVVVEEDFNKKFRVEQLDHTSWTWRPVSTHVGDAPFESFGPSVADMVRKQVRLIEKIKLAQHEDKMARIKAGTVH